MPLSPRRWGLRRSRLSPCRTGRGEPRHAASGGRTVHEPRLLVLSAADALLGQLTEKPGVVALSYSVDYWDYLGWRDTLGSPANSERQRAYARSRGDGKVYTPQAVVDGVTHVNGASEAAIEMAMRNQPSGCKT